MDLWLLADTIALAASSTLANFSALDQTRTLLLVIWLGSFVVLSGRRNRTADNQAKLMVRYRILDWLKSSCIVAGLFYLLRGNEGLASSWVAWTFAFGACAILLVGLLSRTTIFFLAEAGVLGTRLAIYGCGVGTTELLDYIAAERGAAAHVVGLFDERSDRADAFAGYAVRQSTDELIEAAASKHVDCVMLDLPASATARINDLVHRLEQVNVDIVMAPSPVQIATRSRSIEFVGTIPTLSLYRRPMVGFEALAKILIDRVLAIVVLLLSAPIILLAAILIKIESPGPVLFVQKRRGLNNQPFKMFKLRSMHVPREETGTVSLVTRNDPRVTRIGGILRRTSIDELPQLINVLRGEMSLVGPRPHLWEAKAADRRYEEVVRRYPARHRVLPGITGLAQVRGYRGNGDDENEIKNRVRSDIEYIDSWSIFLDLAILVRTSFSIIFQKAY